MQNNQNLNPETRSQW